MARESKPRTPKATPDVAAKRQRPADDAAAAQPPPAPANPLADDPARQHRIRERAYHLWEAEGRVHGRDQEYWERASDLVGMESNPAAGTLPNPIAEGIDPTAPTGVEEASIQANLGEFPDRLSDQGEHQATPSPKRRRKT